MFSQGCRRSPAGWGQWPYGKPAARGAQEDGPGCRSSTPSPPAQQGEPSHHPCKGEVAGSSQHRSLGLWALAGSPQQHSRLLRWRRGSGSQRGGPQACLVADHPSKGRIPQKSQSWRAGGGHGRGLPPPRLRPSPCPSPRAVRPGPSRPQQAPGEEEPWQWRRVAPGSHSPALPPLRKVAATGFLLCSKHRLSEPSRGPGTREAPQEGAGRGPQEGCS